MAAHVAELDRCVCVNRREVRVQRVRLPVSVEVNGGIGIEPECVVRVQHSIVVVIVVQGRIAQPIAIRVERGPSVGRAAICPVEDPVVVVVGVVVVAQAVPIGVNPLIGVARGPVDGVVVSIAIVVVIEVVSHAVVVVVRVGRVVECVAIGIVLGVGIQRVIVVPVCDAVAIIVIID